MKVYRLRHNVETRIYANFIAVGVGVDYINFDNYKGQAGSDIAQLILNEQIWFDVPLFALSRKNHFGTKPYGFKFAHPILLQKGQKARFYTNQSVNADDIHLLFYGFYVPERKQYILQRKPLKMIYLTAFKYDAGQTTMRLPLAYSYDLLSYGYLYSYVSGPGPEEWYSPMPDDIKGYLEILGRKYLFDEDKNRSLNLYSDLYYGVRSLVNDYNLKRFYIDDSECLKLNLSAALSANTSLYTLIEYEKIGVGVQPRREIITPAEEKPPTTKPPVWKPGRKIVIKGGKKVVDREKKQFVRKEYPFGAE